MKRGDIAKWEHGEHIVSQKVIPLKNGKFKHVEIVKYAKKHHIKHHKKNVFRSYGAKLKLK